MQKSIRVTMETSKMLGMRPVEVIADDSNCRINMVRFMSTNISVLTRAVLFILHIVLVPSVERFNQTNFKRA